MSQAPSFPGFPGVTKATAIPNIFFATLLPRMDRPGELLAFLWVARYVQEQKGSERCVTANELWTVEGLAESFENLASGRDALEAGLRRCVELGALVDVTITGRDGAETYYFINNGPSRRAAVRIRTGEVRLKPSTIVVPTKLEDRPGIFRMYEEYIGTITPIVGDLLVEAMDTYPIDWIEEAFRNAAERNIRSWKYVERILERWAGEGARSGEGVAP